MDYKRIETGNARVVHDDCVHAVQMMHDAGIRFDAMVTDPPYGVGSWDWGIPPTETWKTLLEAMKPGAFALVTGNPKTFHRQTTYMEDAGWRICDCLMWVFSHGYSSKIGEAAWAVHSELLGKKAAIQRGHFTEDSTKWKGWGSKLKPAWEPIVLVQRPGKSTMAKDLLAEGLGALNFSPEPSPGQMKLFTGANEPLRPPTNLIMDDQSRASLAQQSNNANIFRMFYCRNVTMKERNAGVDGELANDHPTVKPIGLMRWLISLITPPGGLLLDPYVGSGTTGCAAMMEDVKFVGVDMDEHYVNVAKQRIAWWRGQRAKEDSEMVADIKGSLLNPKVRILTGHNLGPLATCRNGHRLTPDNVYRRPDGRRECATCKRASRKK